MAKKKFPLANVYQLLETGPTVLITSSLNGKDNIMPISWTIPLDFEPPVVGCCLGDQSRTFQIVNKTKEFAINIPTANLVKKVYGLGQISGRTADKFKMFKLVKEPASKIKAPLIRDCYANLECRVIDTSLVSKYNLFIATIVAAWITPGVKNAKTLHHITGKKFFIRGRDISA